MEMMVVRVGDGEGRVGREEPLFQKAIGDFAICHMAQEAWALIPSPEVKKVNKAVFMYQA